MHLVIGQIGVEKPEFELRRIRMAIEKDGMGTGLKGCKAWSESLEPLTWAIAFSYPIQDLDEWAIDKTRANDVILMAKKIATALGHGKYYFRGVDNALDSFWDMAIESVFEDLDVFGGLPLSITVGNLNVIEVYTDWNNEFVMTHYSDYITPFASAISGGDKLRGVYYAFSRLLALGGDWVFKLATRTPIIEEAKPLSIRRVFAN